MSTESTETEVKLYTPDHSPIVAKLHSLGARLIYPRVLERNLRYENATNTLVSEGVTLRLREDSRVRLTYKDKGQVTNGIVTRRELEVEISSLETMNTLLEQLGYHVFMTYEKYRTTYEFYGAEIVIDELPYGNFTEIEGDSDTIEDILRTLDLAQAPRYAQSYALLFSNVKRALGLSINDLTFTNFNGITVPESAFQMP